MQEQLSTHCSLTSQGAVISATESPIAVQAGIEALKQGGNAADATAVVALTQIATQLGSVVSYAGILSLLYYEANTQKIYSLDAGYNSYINEIDPQSIPVAKLDPFLKVDRLPTDGHFEGRKTLVPGFMAGIEAMHQRFGCLPFARLFVPAIHYAEDGVIITPLLETYFAAREKHLARTTEGQQFLRQAGNNLPKAGDRFYQPMLAKTLHAIAGDGAQYMYTGLWGQHFVDLVQREGGKVTFEDMARYQVIWTEPVCTTFLGHSVYVPGSPSHSGCSVLPALNLAEERKLNQDKPYWIDPNTLVNFQHVCNIAENIYFSQDDTTKNKLSQSNAIVIADKKGNIAAITHTINSVIWGDTGMIVDGVPIPDSAGFQQVKLAAIKPGERLPNDMPQTIILRDNKPRLATAAIGASLIPETLKMIIGTVGWKLSLETLQNAPPLISTYALASSTDTGSRIILPMEHYSQDFIKQLKKANVKIVEVSALDVAKFRGTVAAITIDPLTQKKQAVNIVNLALFGEYQN